MQNRKSLLHYHIHYPLSPLGAPALQWASRTCLVRRCHNRTEKLAILQRTETQFYVCIYIHTRVCIYTCHAYMRVCICISLRGNEWELNICFCKAYWLHQWCFLNNQRLALIFDCRLGCMRVNVSNFKWFHPTLTYHTASHGRQHAPDRRMSEFRKQTQHGATRARRRGGMQTSEGNHGEAGADTGRVPGQGADPGTHHRAPGTAASRCGRTLLLICLSWNLSWSKRTQNRILMENNSFLNTAFFFFPDTIAS